MFREYSCSILVNVTVVGCKKNTESRTLISFPSSSIDETTLDGKVPRSRDTDHSKYVTRRRIVDKLRFYKHNNRIIQFPISVLCSDRKLGGTVVE